MVAESYDYLLRFLKLPRGASEEDIRTAITRELRVWTYRQNSPDLDIRQEAERKVKALEAAEQVLLGPEGQIIRSRHDGGCSAESQIEMSVDAETVARAIQRVTTVRGMKTQERKGTVLHRRATIFFRGVDYYFEAFVHKSYEAAQDRTRCSSIQSGLVLFDWTCETGANSGRSTTTTYIEGPWVVDLVALASECTDAVTG
jgi:hypothetical protein